MGRRRNFFIWNVGSDAYSQIMRGVEIGKDNPQAFPSGKKYTGFVLGTGKASDTFASGGGTDSGSYYNRDLGLGLSAEIGKRFQRGNGYFVEPALELAALWSTPASYTTDNGLDVPSISSLQLRLGCAVGRKWREAGGAQREFYGKAGWVTEYAGDSTITVGTDSFDSSLTGHQWVISIGYVEDTGRHQFYADLEKFWGNTTRKEWGLNVGYRWKF